MRRDQENVYTSFANADLLANKFAVRQKYSIDIPTHRHEYIEITYVAQGHVTVVIEGQEVQMRQGDLCIMDKNVRHSSGMMTSEDWVFNLIMTEEFFDTVFMYLLSEDNYISNYIVNSFYSEKKLRRHLLFHLEDEPFLEALLEQILCEYYAGDNWSEGKITSCLVILFTELSQAGRKRRQRRDHCPQAIRSLPRSDGVPERALPGGQLVRSSGVPALSPQLSVQRAEKRDRQDL